MKIKKTNEVGTKFKIKLSHKELVFLKESLELFLANPKAPLVLNAQLFDKDEVDSSFEVKQTTLNMYEKVLSALNESDPF